MQSYERTQTGTVYLKETNLDDLGNFIDGWVELIEDMGDKSKEVRDSVINLLQAKGMPGIRVAESRGVVGLTGGSGRPYIICKRSPGATTATYIGKHGTDLYISWRTYIKPVVREKVLIYAGALAAIVGFFLAVNDVSGWLTTTVIIFILEMLAVAAAGRFIKGNYLAYFFVEPNVFDADNISAMTLSVHKSILRALDSTGIDTDNLRLKREFTGGRRGEMV